MASTQLSGELTRGRRGDDERESGVESSETGLDLQQQLRDLARAHERLSLLANASDLLAQSLDVERIARVVPELGLPLLGDFALFDLAQDGQLRGFAQAHDDAELKARLAGRVWCKPERSALELCALGAGRPVRIVLDEAFLAARPAEDPQVVLLRELGVRSLISVPVGDGLGVLTFFYASSKREHGIEQLSLAEELSRRVESALLNARQYREARDAIGVRDDFLSMAGHELRTPLTALQLQILSISKMVTQPDSSEKVLARADKAARNVLRLSSLVNELLDISRISSGRLRLERGAMDLAEVMREVLHRQAEEISKSGGDLNFTAAGDLTGNWDRVRMDQVATILVLNALKSGAGKPIDLRVQREGESVRLTAHDQGAGISVEDRARIYQPFEKAVSSRHFGGLGFGLWIARQLVEAHGGSFTVHSEPDAGATYEVVLPLTPPAQEGDA